MNFQFFPGFSTRKNPTFKVQPDPTPKFGFRVFFLVCTYRVFWHIIILIKKYNFCLVCNTVSVLFASIGLNLKVTWPLQPYFLRLLICLEEIEKTVRKRRPSQYSVNKKFCFANLGVMNSALEIIYSFLTGMIDKGRHMLAKHDWNYCQRTLKICNVSIQKTSNIEKFRYIYR